MTKIITLNADFAQDAKQTKIVCDYILANSPSHIDRKKTYSSNDDNIQFSHSLIQTAARLPENKKYYVISHDKQDVLGIGTFSKARKIISSIEIEPNGTLTYAIVTNKALRIRNPKRAQDNRIRNKAEDYKHEEALKEYRKAKHFPHIAMEEPIEVIKNSPTLGRFSKSYSVMNQFIGKDFDKTCTDILNFVDPDTKQFLDWIAIPLCEAYKTQIADQGYVHRDIKPENIHFQFYLAQTPPSTINFLDVDSAKKPGKPEFAYGSPGQLAPEVFEDIPVHQARDIFSLGMMLSDNLNPDLTIEKIALDKGAKNGGDLIEIHHNILEEQGCYDLASFGDPFSYIDDNGMDVDSEQKEILEVLKLMTAEDATKRLKIEDVILRFKKISSTLENKYPSATTTNLVDTSADLEQTSFNSTTMTMLALNQSNATNAIQALVNYSPVLAQVLDETTLQTTPMQTLSMPETNDDVLNNSLSATSLSYST